MSLMAKIFASTSGAALATTPAAAAPALVTPPAVPDAAAGAPDPVANADGMVSLADAQGAATEAMAAGAKAESDRYQAVLGSDSGKAHGSTALFMLQHNPTATAESIVAHLDGLKPAASTDTPAPAPAPAPAAAKPLTVALSNIDPIDLGGAGAGANKGENDAPETDSYWKASNESLLAESGAVVKKTGN
jgi:hypothetical protein